MSIKRCLCVASLLMCSCAVVAVTRPSQEKAPEMRRVVIRYANNPSVVLEIVDQVLKKQVEDEVSHFKAEPPLPPDVIEVKPGPMIMDIDMERFAMRMLCVSDVARSLGASPRDISDLFYRREFRDDLCPVMAGRRMIPEDYVDMIAMGLRRHGKLPREGLKRG